MGICIHKFVSINKFRYFDNSSFLRKCMAKSGLLDYFPSKLSNILYTHTVRIQEDGELSLPEIMCHVVLLNSKEKRSH